MDREQTRVRERRRNGQTARWEHVWRGSAVHLSHAKRTETRDMTAERRRHKCEERERMRGEWEATNCMVLSGCCGWGLVVSAKMEKRDTEEGTAPPPSESSRGRFGTVMMG